MKINYVYVYGEILTVFYVSYVILHTYLTNPDEKFNTNKIWKKLKCTYNSEVSAGIPLGISFNFEREHLTTVPVQEHIGGQ